MLQSKRHRIKYAWWNKNFGWNSTSDEPIIWDGIGPDDPEWESVMQSTNSTLNNPDWVFYYYDEED